MRGSKLLAVVAAVSMIAPAVAAEKVDDKKDPNKRICKMEKTTGTRVSGQRICMTRGEWQMLSEESKRAMEGMDPNARIFDRPAEDPR